MESEEMQGKVFTLSLFGPAATIGYVATLFGVTTTRVRTWIGQPLTDKQEAVAAFVKQAYFFGFDSPKGFESLPLEIRVAQEMLIAPRQVPLAGTVVDSRISEFQARNQNACAVAQALTAPWLKASAETVASTSKVRFASHSGKPDEFFARFLSAAASLRSWKMIDLKQKKKGPFPETANPKIFNKLFIEVRQTLSSYPQPLSGLTKSGRQAAVSVYERLGLERDTEIHCVFGDANGRNNDLWLYLAQATLVQLLAIRVLEIEIEEPSGTDRMAKRSNSVITDLHLENWHNFFSNLPIRHRRGVAALAAWNSVQISLMAREFGLARNLIQAYANYLEQHDGTNRRANEICEAAQVSGPAAKVIQFLDELKGDTDKHVVDFHSDLTTVKFLTDLRRSYRAKLKQEAKEARSAERAANMNA